MSWLLGMLEKVGAGVHGSGGARPCSAGCGGLLERVGWGAHCMGVHCHAAGALGKRAQYGWGLSVGVDCLLSLASIAKETAE